MNESNGRGRGVWAVRAQTTLKEQGMRRIGMSLAVVSAAGLMGAAAMAGAKSEKAPHSGGHAKAAAHQSAKAERSVTVGSVAPAWTLKDADGKDHSLADYKGKIVLIDFWATWCPPCKAAMPHVQAVHEKFADKGVVVIGVSTFERGESSEKVSKPAAYMKEKKFTYNLLVNGDEVATSYGVRGIPSFFVVGEDGKVIYAESGFSPSESDKLEKFLAARVASKS
jgi:peroxiredoxin